METMKLYRLVPNALTSEDLVWCNEDEVSFESLYHSLGYVNFTGEIYEGEANKFSKPIEEEGKFFYMCQEHAMEYLLFYPLFNDCFKMMEYEVPIETVYDIIGVGEYGYSRSYDMQYEKPKAESYISKSLFGNAEKASKVLTEQQKIDAFIDNYMETVKAVNVLSKYKEVKPRMSTTLGYDAVKGFSRDDLANYLLENNRILRYFLRNDDEIVKSDFITGKSVIVHSSFEMKDENVNEANRELLRESPFNFDYSKKQHDKKMESMLAYARLLEQGKYDESKEYVKTHFRVNS